ncbi:MAG: hypothetical protein HBSAPP03_04950 [Phycisphaerae bacterium]|nr:MAG: hypothetical protein HBSAPP03_04950 [Phycisphaerae bacterium]
MFVLNPSEVRFGIQRWKDVRAIAIDRMAVQEVIEWGDFGPHATFADVPRTRVRLRVVLEAGADLEAAPRPGDSNTLTFTASPGGGEVGRRIVSAACVAIRVTHEVALPKGATRTIEFVAVSSDGVADPITITPAGV